MKMSNIVSILLIILVYNLAYSEDNYIQSIESSSSVKGYPTKYAFDDNVNTTWACNNTQEKWLRINFGKEIKLYGLHIASGYLKNNIVHNNNNRLKSIYFVGNNQETELVNFWDYKMTLEDYIKSHVDDYSMQFMEDGYADYEYIKKEYSNYLNYIDGNVNSLFYPVIFKTPMTCNSLTIIITDTYRGEEFNEICISEIYPIIQNEKYSDPRLNELRDIGNIFEKLSNNDKSILPSGTEVIKQIRYRDGNNIEIDDYISYTELHKFSIDKIQTIRYIIDPEQKYLILWNGKSVYLENGISSYPILFFQKNDQNWEILAISEMHFYTIHEIMPYFINLKDKTNNNILSIFDSFNGSE